MPERFNIAEAVCERHAYASPDATAVIEDDPERGHRRVSFADLEVLASATARGLAAGGIRSGDRVAITLEQGVDALAVHLACFKLGAISVPIASLYGTEGLSYRLRDSGARMLVTDAAGAAKVLRKGAGARPATLESIAIADGSPAGSEAFPLTELTRVAVTRSRTPRAGPTIPRSSSTPPPPRAPRRARSTPTAC